MSELTYSKEEYLAAARALREEQPGRAVPSPSSVNKCTRQNWVTHKRNEARREGFDIPFPTDNFPDNGETYLIAESGRESETVMARIVEKAGWGQITPGRELTPEELERLHMKGGAFDRMLNMSDGQALLEFKRKGVRDMLALITDGLLLAKPDEYTQMQCYMYALNLDRGLYIAANWDRGMFTEKTRYLKQWREEPRPDAVHIEWITPSPLVISGAVGRAEMQTQVNETVAVLKEVPRDFNPHAKRFPCTWCDVFNACKAVGE